MAAHRHVVVATQRGHAERRKLVDAELDVRGVAAGALGAQCIHEHCALNLLAVGRLRALKVADGAQIAPLAAEGLGGLGARERRHLGQVIEEAAGRGALDRAHPPARPVGMPDCLEPVLVERLGAALAVRDAQRAKGEATPVLGRSEGTSRVAVLPHAVQRLAVARRVVPRAQPVRPPLRVQRPFIAKEAWRLTQPTADDIGARQERQLEAGPVDELRGGVRPEWAHAPPPCEVREAANSVPHHVRVDDLARRPLHHAQHDANEDADHDIQGTLAFAIGDARIAAREHGRRVRGQSEHHPADDASDHIGELVHDHEHHEREREEQPIHSIIEQPERVDADVEGVARVPTQYRCHFAAHVVTRFRLVGEVHIDHAEAHAAERKQNGKAFGRPVGNRAAKLPAQPAHRHKLERELNATPCVHAS